MSNISRRKFLKGAGVAALAVAAAGVLAGCSGNGENVPMKDVVVIFKNKADGKEVAPRGTVKVPAADGTVAPSKVTAPDNYVVVDTEAIEIKTYEPAEDAEPDDKAYEYIEVQVAFGEGSRNVTVNFVCDGEKVKTTFVAAKFNASVVAASAFQKDLPSEYEIIDPQDEYTITDGEVEYNFYYQTGTWIVKYDVTVMEFTRPMLATVKEVPGTDSNIPSAFTGTDGKQYKVTPKASYPVQNGMIKIEVEAI